MSDTICVIGNGYVGLPLAIAFAEKYRTISFSPSPKHTEELKAGYDRTQTFSAEELERSGILFTSDVEEIREANIYIVTAPTPIDDRMKPDLRPIEGATKTVARVLKQGDIVVYESTVFIGCTETLCVPLLETESGMKFNRDFFCGYSPERINPADKEHTLATIKKVVSGSTPDIAERLRKLYESIIPAGIYLAPAIKVAEASKLIENVQRDLNIALMNQLSMLFDRLKVDTNDVIDAASTKWNFLRFKPGLVGGHCISVDPYYLIYNGEQCGMEMSLVKTQREVNEHMSEFVALKTLSLLQEKGHKVEKSRVLILGVSFKENCPDIRNTKVVDVYKHLKPKVAQIDLYDPVIDVVEFEQEYGIACLNGLHMLETLYEAVILAVPHEEILAIPIREILCENGVLYDLKGVLPRTMSDARL